MSVRNILGFDSNKHDVRTEVTSGLTAFITICYILAVIPSVLTTTGIDQTGAFTTTALITAAATLLSAFVTKQPYILGPGLGLNAFFAFTLVSAGGYSGTEALTLVFVEGILFLVLVLANVHRYILSAIPESLRNALVAGIGMFIAFIGLKNAGMVVSSPDTIVTAGAIDSSFLLGMLSILLCGILIARGIKGAMFYSILACTIIGIPMGVTSVPEHFTPFSFPHLPSLQGFDFGAITGDVTGSVVIIFTLLIINIFDALGSMIGVSSYTGDGGESEQKHVKGAYITCSAASIIGSMFGMSPISVMAESSSGAASGGRSGMSAAIAGILFIAALFLSPIFMLIPMEAATGCLVIVGVYMISAVSKIDFKDMSEALPAFITILATVLTFSIADGISFGMITYVIIKIFTRRFECINVPMCILALLFVIKQII